MLYTPSIHYTPRRPTGAKLALKPVHVWGIRVQLQVSCRARDLALFDLALDSKLRGCDLVRFKVSDLLSPSEGLPALARSRSETSTCLPPT